MERGAGEWTLEGSGLGPKRQFRGALVFLRVLEEVQMGPEKAVRDTETPKSLDKLDA